MLFQETQTLAHDVGPTPKVPSLLLHLLAVALLACISAGAAFLLYWSFSDTVSTYRRQMNAAAYSAQLFFDQRETLLRSLSSSTVRNSDSAPASQTPRYFGNTEQIEVFPLLEAADSFDWALILTPRDLTDVARAHSRLLFSSVRTDQTTLVVPQRAGAAGAIAADKQTWIARRLAAADASVQADGQYPIVWLKPPMDEQNRLYLFTPLSPATPQSGWIGLEVMNMDAAIDLSSLRAGSYVLYDQHDEPVVHSAGAPFFTQFGARPAREDSFGWWGAGLLPRFVVLNKSVGEAGWRLVYYAPISRVLADSAFAIQGILAGAALLFAAVVLGVRHIRQKLVTPTVRHYEALADSVALNRNLVEVAPVGLCLLRRADGVPKLSNELARQWLLSDSDLLSRLCASNDFETGREFTLKDGRFVYLTFASMTYCGEDVVLCSINDITAFKLVESSIMRAKQEADAANHAKTVFLATMSHEIRTPLFGILGTLEMLGLTAMDSQQQQYLETMQQSSATLLRTINDTLDLSRIEAGYLKLESAMFSPVELLDDVVSSYAARAQAKKLHIYALADISAPAAVTGDLTRIRQVLNNLVSNAIKFTNSGHVVLRLQTLSLDTHRATLKFQVADTGYGISSEHHARLFEPYYRAEEQPQGVPGTGLGLAICRRLSEMMGGTLSAVSEPGLGTSMSLELSLPLAGEVDSHPVARLDPKPVFVRGAVHEVVNNLCQWLRHWGAVAMPYKSAHNGRREGGVLVETWPQESAPAPWDDARVIARPPGVPTQFEGGETTWTANAYSLSGIANAVRLAQDGVRAAAATDALVSLDALGMHVLVVEDNPISQQVLREQLEHLGCTVVLASNGEEALGRPDIPAFDAILTDLQMPLLDGYGLTRALRGRGYERPIVGITASAFTEEVERSSAVGMTAILLKPLPVSALRQALSAIKEGKAGKVF